MAHPINYTKTKRILFLIDLNPLLQNPNPNPNPNFINTIITTSNIILSFPPLSSSLFSFKLFFSSLSPLRSATALRRILPDHPSASLTFDSPSQTLKSLTTTLNSVMNTQSTYTSPSCENTVSLLNQLAIEYDWDNDVGDEMRNEIVDIRSNLIILLSPVCRNVNELAEFMCYDLNYDLEFYRGRFCDCFGSAKDVFSVKDIHFCWVDITSSEIGGGIEFDVVRDEIRKFGWGFCSSDAIVYGSAVVSFGLIYPSIVVSSKMLDCCGLDKGVRAELCLEVLDVSGKPLEGKCCDLELLQFKDLSKRKWNDGFRTREVGSVKSEGVDFVNTLLGGLRDGVMKLRVTEVRRYTECKVNEELDSKYFLVRFADIGKKGKNGLDSLFADRILELLAKENSELFDKRIAPTWKIFLNFLYREGYWAMLSLSDNNGNSCKGILKPFTIHSAILLVVADNHFSSNSSGPNLLMNKNVSQKDTSPSGQNVHVGDLKRKKMKKHSYQNLTWSSFCKAAYELWDVDLAEVYFANGCKKAKKLKFLKCWMTRARSHRLCRDNTPHGSAQDSNQQKEADVNGNLADKCEGSDEHVSTIQYDDTALVSFSETSESFFCNLPKIIQHGLESEAADLKIVAERLVNQSIYWLRQKHETMEDYRDSRSVQVSEIINLLLREPKDIKQQSSTSEHLVREYELQILLRLEILQSEYAESIKGSMKSKLVKQICTLLEIIQYLVEGGFHGNVSLYAYVERTIKARYSHNLKDVVDKIYDQMDLLPFGEENEDQALMFNSEDSNQSWREKNDKHDILASKKFQESLSKDESSHPLENLDTKLNEARERRERARRFVSFTSRMPDLQRVWAPKQSKAVKVKPENKRKKQKRGSYSVVCETPMAAYSDLMADKFLQCLTQNLNATDSEFVFTKENIQYSSVLESTIINLRYVTSTTPKPFAIVTPLTYSHVQSTILCSKTFGYQIRIRSGGHDYAGVSYTSYDKDHSPFIVLDLKELRSITIDSSQNTAWVESGATLGELYYWVSQQSQNLAFPGGICPTVGVGGQLSGGGFGTMVRKYGLAADNVIDARIIDVNGRILDRKSMGEDLFWAIRGGGGGSFGVVVAWKVNLVYVPDKVSVFSLSKTLEQGGSDLFDKWQYIGHELS
nr:putative treslin [Tanacetum cinerariifolium]